VGRRTCSQLEVGQLSESADKLATLTERESTISPTVQ